MKWNLLTCVGYVEWTGGGRKIPVRNPPLTWQISRRPLLLLQGAGKVHVTHNLCCHKFHDFHGAKMPAVENLPPGAKNATA